MSGTENTVRPDDDEEGLEALLRLAGARPPVAPERTARVRAAVHERWQAARRSERRRRSTGMLTALGAAAALVLVFRGGRPPAPPPSPAATVERAAGGSRVLLPDSSAALVLTVGDVLVSGAVVETSGRGSVALRVGGVSLRVDRNTRLRLAGARSLQLDHGAIYVDSGRGGVALEVRTTQGVVRDVGTRFEVRAGPGSLRVRVREGEILLERPGSSERASAGTELRVESGRITRRAVSAVDPDWAWATAIAPAFELEGQRLSDFLDWYSRETGRTWRLAAGLEKRTGTVLHGSVADLTPEEALQVVLPPCALAARMEGETVWIVAAGSQVR